jgi:adenylate cyclase
MAERGSEEWWRNYLLKGHRLEGVARLVFPHLPASPRCKVCRVPFGGLGRLLRYLGWSPSRKNPQICGFCSDRLPPGGAEIELAVLVADVRGYTQMSEHLPGKEVAELMNRFYALATDVLLEHDALIDKFMGDSVQALFIPGVAGVGYCQKAFLAGQALLKRLGSDTREAWLPVGIGINAGIAFVGNVGAASVVDLTAIGDTVNVASRIQAQAAPGEILMSESIYEAVSTNLGELEFRSLTVKGKEEPINVRVWTVR